MPTTYPERGLQRILLGAPSALMRATLFNQDGEPTAAAGVVTVNIARADGTVLATGRATAAGVGVGRYTATLTTAETATLDVLKVTWLDGATVRATTHHRIVGGFLFAPSELLQRDGLGQSSLDAVRAVRDVVTDVFEKETGVCWFPTYDLDSFSHVRSGQLMLPRYPLRAVRSITANGVAASLVGLEVDEAAGQIYTSVSASSYLTLVGYEHGFSGPPADLREEAMNAARDALLRQRSGLSDRARQLQNEMGTVSFSFAGPGHPTGIDSVDAALRRHDHRTPMVA